MVKWTPYYRRIFQARPLRGILCLLSLILPTEAWGTVAAMIRTDQQIVIAADSMKVNSLRQPIGSVCKIVSTTHLFSLPNGFVIGIGPRSYNAIAIAREVANESKGIEEIVRRFIDTIRSPLAANLQSVHETNPDLFQKVVLDEHPLGITFAGYEHGALVMSTLDFLIKDHTATSFTLHIDGFNCIPGKECYSLVAPQEFQERFLREHPGWPKGDTIAAARLFVQQAIDEHLPTVGPPLSLLVITPTGARWDAPGLCQDTQK